jgi:hypothetical protein
MHNAEPTKNTSNRHTNDLNAGGRILRGFSVSAATIDMYSGPVMLHIVSLLAESSIKETVYAYLKLAWYRQESMPKNVPGLPGSRC